MSKSKTNATDQSESTYLDGVSPTQCAERCRILEKRAEALQQQYAGALEIGRKTNLIVEDLRAYVHRLEAYSRLGALIHAMPDETQFSKSVGSWRVNAPGNRYAAGANLEILLGSMREDKGQNHAASTGHCDFTG